MFTVSDGRRAGQQEGGGHEGVAADHRGLPPHQGLRIAAILAVFLGLGASVLLEHKPYTFLWGDATFYANVNRSLAVSGSFRQDEMTARSWYYDELGWNRKLGQEWSNVALGADGESLYPKHHVLLPLAAQPLYLLLGNNGLLLFNLLLMVLAAGLLVTLLEGVGTGGVGAAVVVLLAYLGPAAIRDVYHYSNDQFSACLFLLGYVVFLGRLGAAAGTSRGTREDVWPHVLQALGGIAWGALVWAKPVHGLLVAAAGAPLIWAWVRDRRWSMMVAAGAGFLGVLAIHGVVNWAWFGSPFETSYDRILVRDGGVLMLDSARTAFNQPLPKGLHALLFTHRLAFIKGFPLLVFYPLGLLVMAWRGRWKHASLSLFVISGVLLIYGRYDYPSHRFLFPFLFFALSPIAALANEGVAAARRLYARWRLLDGPGLRRVAAVALGLVLATGLLRVAWPRLVDDISRPRDLERLRVMSDDRVPCDFFNLKVQRWECSHSDRGPDEMVGAPKHGECAIPPRAEGAGKGTGASRDDERAPWLRFPLYGTWKSKTVTVTAPAGAVGFRYRAIPDPGTARALKGSLQVSVDGPGALAASEHAFGAPPPGSEGSKGNEVHARVPVRAGQAVTLRVDQLDGRRVASDALCIRWEWIQDSGT